MSQNNNPKFVEGRDFYIENGLYVFTEYYLKNRGYCCDNGCRHCPYRQSPPCPPQNSDSKQPRKK